MSKETKRHTAATIFKHYEFKSIVPAQGYYGGLQKDSEAIKKLKVSERIQKKHEYMSKVLKVKPLYVNNGIEYTVIYGLDNPTYWIPKDYIFDRVAKTIKATPETKKKVLAIKKQMSTESDLLKLLKLNSKLTKILLTINLVEFDPRRYENQWKGHGGGFYV